MKKFEVNHFTNLRLLWCAIALLVFGFIAVAVPNRYAQLTTISPNANTLVGQLQPAEAYALEQAGIPVPIFAAYMTTLGTFIAIVFALIGLAVAWLQPQDRMALLASIVLIGAATVVAAAGMFQPQWRLIVIAVRAIFGASVVPFFFLFPDGRFVPRWTRWLTGIWLIYTVTWLIFPSLSPPFSYGRGFTGSELLRNVWFLLWFCIGLAVQIYRYLKFSNAIQRQQIKVVVFGFGIGLVALVTGISILTITRLAPLSSLAIFARLFGASILLLGTLAGPLSIGISILRYHLFDIDVIINRTLVYGALIVSIIGLYMVVVGTASVLFQSVGNTLLSILATGLIAVLFHPLQQRLQRGINRLMYGERDDPIEALSRLGKQMEVALPADQVLPMLVKTIAQTLRLPFVAMALKGQRLTAFGQQADNAVTFPLTFQGETTGELLAAPRSPGESFTPPEMRLLQNLAHQAGAAVRNSRLTADLQRSRQTIVTAREEERIRLRRDLHDGIGPTMAGLTLKLDAARDLVSSGLETGEKENLEEALQLLGELKAQTQETVQNIRHIVHTLRPPSLDVLGLVPALQAHFGQVATRRSPNIQMTTAPQSFPRLSAAVEVAAYRIVLEAVTNVINHAQAGNCEVSLVLENGNLKMEIKDDGVGLPKARSHGIGLNSMRERAEELGGRLELSSSPQGTRVCAEIPISPAGSER